MRKIVIVGTTGSGKTTLAAALAERLHIKHIEVDALHWLPDWQERNRDETRALIAPQLAADGWVVDGNYSFLRDLVWGQADTLIWLDYPLYISQRQLFWRTWQRVRSGELLWGTNREGFAMQFLTTDSLFFWAIKSRRKHKRDFPQLFQQPDYAHLNVLRMPAPSATQAWLQTVGV